MTYGLNSLSILKVHQEETASFFPSLKPENKAHYIIICTKHNTCFEQICTKHMGCFEHICTKTWGCCPEKPYFTAKIDLF
jgi:hypothetical protein